ncbi:glycoside hydrolase family 12 protein [Xylaria intraflava]|nr:glycoside hydrolase family 12 protein [Xylaria intraflava]
MRHQLWTLVALSPLATYALPSRPRDHKCGGGSAPPSSIVVPTTTVTTGLPLSDFSSVLFAPAESLPTTTFPTDVPEEAPTTTVTTGLPLSDFPSFTAVPPESLPTVTYTTYSLTHAAAPSHHPVASQAVDQTYAQATPIEYEVRATTQCGNTDRLILPGMPWTVANSMYNANQMVGQQCTNFDGVRQAADGSKEVDWTSVTDIDLVSQTKDVCKGYSNVGVGVNLDKKLGDITSIPTYFQWNHTNTTEFRGSNLYDFVVAPTPGDTTSTKTSEFMLWIRNWGDQVPIGYASGPVAKLNLFGSSWSLYEGRNPGSGVTVRSMLADQNYDGEFRGDLKDWLDAMVQRGYVSAGDYVTAGNAGTEIFYGKAVMHATVALDINV